MRTSQKIMLAAVVVPVTAVAVAVALAVQVPGQVHHRPAAVLHCPYGVAHGSLGDQCSAPDPSQPITGLGAPAPAPAAGPAKAHPMAVMAATGMLHHLVPHLRLFRSLSLFRNNRRG